MVGSSAILLQDLVGQALASFPLASAVIAVELSFCIYESTYLVQIHIRCNVAIPCDLDALRLKKLSVLSARRCSPVLLGSALLRMQRLIAVNRQSFISIWKIQTETLKESELLVRGQSF